MTDRIGAGQRARSAAMLVSGVTGDRAMACANAASSVWRPIVAELRTALAAHDHSLTHCGLCKLALERAEAALHDG